MIITTIALIITLFIVGYGWLQVLLRHVTSTEAVIIRRKYIGWIPISIVFLALTFLPALLARLVYLALVLYGYKQLFSIFKQSIPSLWGLIGSGFLILSTLSFFLVLFPTEVLFFIILGSVIADISTYSFAKLAPTRHGLSPRINAHKTWEGIVGGICGPFLVLPICLWLFPLLRSEAYVTLTVLIGSGAVCGDLINSLTKRQMRIADWGEAFPGHGGIFDRFGSFFVSYTLIALWETVLSWYAGHILAQ